MDLALYGLILLIGIIVLAIVWFVVKNIGKLVINSVLGLLLLFVCNYFHVMRAIGKPDIPVTWISVVFCALAGIPGALLIILLHLMGFSLTIGH